MRLLITIPIVFFLSACAYSSSVTKIGTDTYYITGTAGSERGGALGAKNAAISGASEYCLKQNKQVNIVSSNSSTVNELGTGSAEVTFKCLP